MLTTFLQSNFEPEFPAIHNKEFYGTAWVKIIITPLVNEYAWEFQNSALWDTL